MSRPLNLIFGLSSGYGFEKLEVFFRSLKASGYCGDVCLFYDKTDSETLSKLREFGTILVPFRKCYFKNPLTGATSSFEGRMRTVLNAYPSLINRLPLDLDQKLRLAKGFASRFFHVANTRFVLSYLYLLESGATYDNVMIADVRDVCFQKDPFDVEMRDQLHVFNEEPVTVGTACASYKEWFSRTYGEPFLDRFNHRRISCCGVTIGSRDRMLSYLREVSKLMCFDSSLESYCFGMDSAVHNFVIYDQKVPDIAVHENLEGPVLTMGTMPRERILVKDGVVVDRNNCAIITLHQYDRHPDIKDAITTRLIGI